jgi:surface protein
MAIIHSYPGGEPESGDKLIVTDAAGRKTKSVSVDSIVSYVNDANYVGPGVVLTQIDNTTIVGALTAWLADNTTAEFTDATNTPYYGPITNWDTSGVTSMYGLFDADFNFSGFNEDISGWDVSNVTDMGAMFWSQGDFNQDLSSWDVSKVTSFESMFYYATEFDSDISGWDTSNAENMAGMFQEASAFNRDLSKWDVSKVRTMSSMFSGADSFSSYLNSWNVGNVTDMSWMFSGTDLNPSLTSWKVGDVTDMSHMFRDCPTFTGNGLQNWDTSEVTSMSYMFYGASSFSGNIRFWNVSSVTSMYSMFSGASVFNIDISPWDVSNVTDMGYMFIGASAFYRDISSWNVPKIAERPIGFTASSPSTSNEPKWGVNKLEGTAVKASGVEIANITDPKHLVTKEFVEETVSGSGYSHTGAFADKPSTNDRVWEAGQGINYTQADANAGLWKVFSINEAVHLEVDNPYWTDPAPDTITNGVFTNTNTGKGLFQGKHLPQGVSSLVDYTYSYDVEHFNNLNMFGYSNSLLGFTKLNGVTTLTNQAGEGTSGVAAKLTFNNNVGSVQASVTVHPGQTYFVSWYAKLDTGGNAFNPAYSIANKSDGNSAIIPSTAYGNLLNDTSYSLIGVGFTAPANCYEVSVKIATANSTSGAVFIDKPQMNDGTSRGFYTPTSGGAATTPKITHNYYEYPNSKTGYEGSTGRIKLNDIKVGDQLRVRFDFNVTPQIPNTTVEPALWYSNRTVNDQITYSFPLTTQPIFYGSGTVGNTFLNRPEISAWITSEEDINALALPAIKSDNPVIIQPLGLLITIIR